MNASVSDISRNPAPTGSRPARVSFRSFLIGTVLTAGLLGNQAVAQTTYYWDGSVSTLGRNNANWNTAADGTGSDGVHSDKAATYVFNITPLNGTPQTLTDIFEGGEFIIRTSSSVTHNGTRFWMYGNGMTMEAGAGPLTLNAGANMMFFTQSQSIVNNSASDLTHNDVVESFNGQAGVITMAGSGSGDLVFNGNVGGTRASHAIAIDRTGTGIVEFNNATGNNYSLGTTVKEGLLLVNNTSGSGTGGGAVTVESGGILGGSGSISGNVTFQAGAGLVFDPLTTLDMTGTVTMDSTFGVSSLVDSRGGAIDWSTIGIGSYTLIGSTTSDFSGITNFGSANAADVGGGKSAYFENGSLQLIVIPEPSTLALFGLAGVAVVMGLRRRRG